MTNKNIKSVLRLSESLEDLSEPIDLYILFIDLCDSTKIKQYCLEESIPDSIWIMRLKVFLSRTSRIIQQYKGTIVKTIGDEVMATFAFDLEPEQIIKCVIEVFQTFENLKSYNKGLFKIKSKASIDFGVCYDGQLLTPQVIDPIGPAVDRCARLGKFVNYNEIIFSEAFKATLEEKNFDFKKYKIIDGSEEMKGLGKVDYRKIIL